MSNNKFSKNIDNRTRDKDGKIRKKNGDTRIDTLRGKYGKDFGKGYRSDAKLGNVLKKEDLESLSQFLKKQKK